jgi:4-carboxymuconolactone decarboxylase
MPDSAKKTASIDELRAEIVATLGPKLISVTPALREMADTFVYGAIWSRPGLSDRERSIATIAAVVGTHCSEELQLQTLRGLANGLSTEEIGEILTQLVPYVGFPLVISAAASIAELVDRVDQKPQS